MNAGMKMMLAAKIAEPKMEQQNGSSMNYGRSLEGNGTQGRDNPHMGYGNRMAYDGGNQMEYPEGRGNRMGFDGARNEYGDPEIGNEYARMGYAESKYLDRQGKPHYNNGKYAPHGEMQSGAEGRMENDGGPSMHYDKPQGGKMQMGFSSEEEVPPLTQFSAEKWTHGMKGLDGVKGPHWSVDQVKQLMKNKRVDCDMWEFYAAMNAIYSDYAPIFQKYGVGDNIDFYIDMAKAFIDDPDAQPDKLGRYFQYVVKH